MKLVIRGKKTFESPKELELPEYYIDDVKNPFLIVKKEDETFDLISATLDINHINFFIGANNSGKSRFMRGLLKISPESYEYICKSTFYLDLLDSLSDLYNKIEDKSFLERFELEIDKIKKVIPTENSSISDFRTYKRTELLERIKNGKREIGNEIESSLNNYIVKLEIIIAELWFSIENRAYKKTYIPILRSLLENDDLGVESFKKTVKKVFFENKDFPNHININTGLGLWSDMSKIHNSRKIGDIENFSNFLSQHFFDNEKVQLLPDREDPKLIQININNKGFRGVNEIGDGVQTIILLLFPIFTAQRNECFYIEEPETNLHPAFQRIFIETLLTNEFLAKKNLKYFFTTHSNHFLDLTLRSDKVSFFQFKKVEENKHLIKTNIKPSKETLDELGVNNSSVFLANTSLWVEGPTDRKYLARFLRLYCKHENKPYLKEDIDFAFFEYGGNLIAHYLFNENEKFDDDEIRENINAFANANKIYLLADNDNVKEGDEKFSRQKKLENLAKENNSFKYQNTVVKEIENLLPVKVIKDFMKEIVGENVVEKLKTISFTMNDYKDKGLGEFYEDEFLKIGIPKYQNDKKAKDKMRSFKKGNTLETTYKNKLANFVIDRNYTYEVLIEGNDHLKDLIEGLYSFINNENSTEKE